MTRKDDRTTEERSTHTIAVAMTDSFMSGWGGARGGSSVAAWAFDPRTTSESDLLAWVERRGDSRRVRVVSLAGYRPRCAHLHIYAVHPGHPSGACRVTLGESGAANAANVQTA